MVSAFRREPGAGRARRVVSRTRGGEVRRALLAGAAALVLMVPAAAAARGNVHGPAVRPPTLAVTNPSSGVVDLAWQNVPGEVVTVFGYDVGVCRFGCETEAVNNGFEEIDNPNLVGHELGFEVCSDTQPQVCTERVWIDVS